MSIFVSSTVTGKALRGWKQSCKTRSGWRQPYSLSYPEGGETVRPSAPLRCKTAVAVWDSLVQHWSCLLAFLRTHSLVAGRLLVRCLLKYRVRLVILNSEGDLKSDRVGNGFYVHGCRFIALSICVDIYELLDRRQRLRRR